MSALEVRAEFAFKSDRLDKVLFNKVYVNGEVFRDHTWVEHHKDMDEFESGDVIVFTAKYHTFMGLDSDEKYVQKKGFKNIRNLKIVRP